jgi:YD repeat-containing protein
MRRVVVAVSLVHLMLSAPGGRALAEDRSSLRPSALSLPAAPGSIAGLGDALAINTVQGSATFKLPLELPAGAGGHRPTLALAYNGAAGSGEVGVGWSLGLPVIKRSTRHGLPGAGEGSRTYRETDRLLLQGIEGAGELVAMPDGSFRLDPEEGFLRASAAQVALGIDGGIAVQAPDGKIYGFGLGPSERVVGPAGTFAWHLSFMRDVHGHVVRFEYDNTGNCPRLLRVIWNEEAGKPLTASVAVEWEARPDAVRSYLSGALSALTMRVNKLVVARGSNVHRTLILSYADAPGLSRLSRVELVGWDGTASPPLTLGYADEDMSSAAVHAISNPPGVGFQSQSVELTDLDGNALPDLIEMDPDRFAGAYRVFYNRGGDFAPAEMLRNTPSVWLGRAGAGSYLTQWLDADGDGRADIVAAALADGGPDTNLRYFANRNGVLGGSKPLGGASATLSPFQSGTRISDLDLDHKPDLIRTGDDGTIRVAWGAMGWSRDTVVGSLPDASFTFSNAAVKLVDLNGDRLDDLAIQASDRLTYYAGTGFGTFDRTPTRIEGLPRELSEAEFAAAQLRDMTGDGYPDLVQLGISSVRIWPLVGSDRFASEPTTVSALPARDPITTELRLADMNGNGTTDLLWVDVTHPAPAGSWLYVDLLEQGSPALLRTIDNGLGARTVLSYAGMAEVQRAAARAQLEADAQLVIPMMMVVERRAEDGLALARAEHFTYAGGLFDGLRQEFLGFGRVRTERLATDAGPADGQANIGAWQVDEQYHLGRDDRALAGRLLRKEERAADGFVHVTETQRHDVVVLGETAVDGTKLRRGVLRERVTTRREKQAEDSAATTRTRYEPDRLGFIARELDDGLVDLATPDPSASDRDQRVTERDFIHDTSRWRLGLVAAERTTDAAGAVSAAKRYYFDELPLGQVGARGVVTAEEVWIRADEWSRIASREYDQHGQVVEERGADGQRTSTRYDGSGTYLASVERATGNSAQPSLAWRATFDPAQGDLLTSLQEPDGAAWRMRYDGLGRLKQRFAPDDGDQPSTWYEYTQASPISYVTSYRALNDRNDVACTRTFQSGTGQALATSARVRDDVWQVTGVTKRNALDWTYLAYEPFEVRSAQAPSQPPSTPPEQPYSSTAFDEQQRELSRSDARGARTVRVFGAHSVTTFDPLDVIAGIDSSAPTVRATDGLGRLVRVVEKRPSGASVSYEYEYDASARITRADDAHGLPVRAQYDGRGLMTVVAHPDLGQVLFEYDASGRMITRTDGDGAKLRSEYDLLGRLTATRGQAGDGSSEAPVFFHYDVDEKGGSAGHTLGRLASSESEAGTVHHQYDARGRSVVQTRKLSNEGDFTLETEWDRGDRPTRRIYPDGRSIAWEYDLLGRVTRVPAWVDQLSYDPAGRLRSASMGTLAVEAEYDPAGLQTRIRFLEGVKALVDRTREIDANGNPLIERDAVPGRQGAAVKYAYDDLDRLSTMTDALGVTGYTHDERNRLTAITSPHSGYSRQLGYDADSASALPRSHDGEALTWSTGGKLFQEGTRSWTWNARGQLTALREADVSATLLFDEESRLTVHRTETQRSLLISPEYRVDGEQNSIVLRFGSNLEIISSRQSNKQANSIAVPGTSGPFTPTKLWLLALCILLAMAALHGAQGRPVHQSLAALGGLLALIVACRNDGSDSPSVHDLPGTVVRVLDWQGSPIYEHSSTTSQQLTRLPYGWSVPGDVVPRSGFVGGQPIASSTSQLGARPFESRLGVFARVDDRLWKLGGPALEAPRLREAVSYGSANPVRYSDPKGEEAEGEGDRAYANESDSYANAIAEDQPTRGSVGGRLFDLARTGFRSVSVGVGDVLRGKGLRGAGVDGDGAARTASSGHSVAGRLLDSAGRLVRTMVSKNPEKPVIEIVTQKMASENADSSKIDALVTAQGAFGQSTVDAANPRSIGGLFRTFGRLLNGGNDVAERTLDVVGPLSE